MLKVLRIHSHTIDATQSSATSQRHRRDAFLAQAPLRSIPPVGVDASTGRARREENVVVEVGTPRCRGADDVAASRRTATCSPRGSLGRTRLDAVRISRCLWTCIITNRGVRLDLICFRMTRTVNGTGHTDPSEFCATSI